jgi:hypothetical protein
MENCVTLIKVILLAKYTSKLITSRKLITKRIFVFPLAFHFMAFK